MGDEVVRERHGNALLVRINRPDQRNALNPAVFQGLGEAILEAEADVDIRVLVVTGTGDRSFCAGMDLKSLAAGEPMPGGDIMPAVMRLMDGSAGVPTIGAANASALGGGLELLLGCDLIVASSEAQFGLPEVKRGLFPGGGGTAIGRRIPMGLALELLLTGDPITAERGYEIGLVNAVVAPDDVVPAALALAERIAVNAPLSLAAVLELAKLYAVDPAKARERRSELQASVFGSEDAAEGAAAFAEKRTPTWKGR